MYFEINNMTWEIIEKTQAEIKEEINKKEANEDENPKNIARRFFGITYSDDLIIYLDKDLPKERKRRTLLHELTHCYIVSFITHQEKNYDEEMVADIVCNSFDIISKVVERYFKEEEQNSIK